MNEKLYESYVLRVNASELRVCRFCVRKKRKMKVISGNPANGLQLADLFKQITQRHLETNSEYPDFVCNECETVLNETANHILAFQEADTFWRTYFQRQEQKCLEMKFENDNFIMDNCSAGGSSNDFELQANDQPISIDIINDESFVLATDMGDIKIEITPQPYQDRFSSIKPEFEGKDIFLDGDNLFVERLDENIHTFKCNTCSIEYYTKSELKKHMDVYHEANMCPECGVKFQNCRKLSSHMRRHRNKIVAVNGVFTCTACKETFKRKIAYREHIRVQHKNTIRNCNKCRATFVSITRLRKHMDQMHSDRPSMQCDICKALFHSKGQLTNHMRSHIEKSSYICDLCGQELKSLDSVNRHRLKHDQDDSAPRTDDRRRTGNRQPGHLQCLLCSNTFSRSATLRDHMKKKHPIDGPSKWEELMQLMCLKCDEIFPNDHALKEHRDFHNKFTCPVCKQNMTCKEALEYHMGTHSAKERPHACQLCGATYILKTHLAQHTRRVHTLERPHVCDLCGRAFAEKHELGKHTRAVHLQERRFGCDQCGRKFKKHNDLKVHQQSHTGIYRYQCKICNKNFGNSTQFMGHNANKHPNLKSETL